MAGICQFGEIFHSAEIGSNLPKIGYGIAAVRLAFGGIQQRHQVQIVDAALSKIG